MATGCVEIQHSQATTRRRGAPVTRPTAGPQYGTVGATWSAGYALGAPSHFLDSVLFLSHCFDTVHEQCSQKIFEIFFK